MKYKIVFELPDNETVLSKINTAQVEWAVWGYSGCAHAEPEQKTGKWIVWGGMDVSENHGRHKCSECGEFALLRYEKPLRKEILSDFCPNCGSRMLEEGGEDDE